MTVDPHAPIGEPGAPDGGPVGDGSAPDGAPVAGDPGAHAAGVVAPRIPSSTSRVLAVLVVHDGEPWLRRTLTALASQSHTALEVVAVDNGSTDGSRRILQDHLGRDRVLVADRDLGYGAAISMALDARGADPATYLLFLHDDLDLAPHAVAALAEALDDDPRLGVVGPKLLEWDDASRLQSVGWTVDLTGRADSGVDEGELDQGQRDIDRRTLYVSTGGMLVRRDVFEGLGRFDRRYHLFRDDLDLCWRAWLTGWDVEVVPAATADHAAAAATYQRLGQTRFLGPRYFAERNTLATLLKNYAPGRLALVMVAFFAVGIAKVLGFLLTRRFSDAWQTVRAWAWNVLHLRETRRLRVQVQRARTRRDREVRELFGRVAPRLRAYAEAIGEWVAGGEVADPVSPNDVSAEPASTWSRLVRAVRSRPVLVVGALLGVLVTVGAVTMLAPGQLRGGELAPWPVTPAAFLDDHLAAWHAAAGAGTDATPSPAQLLLGLLQVLLGGSAYLASRLLLLGSLLAAWILALRATQRYSARKLPRVAAATAYVLSPPALAALFTGQVGALVVLAVLPGLVAAAGTYAVRGTPPTRGWRAAAGAALLGAIAGSFVPVVLPTIALVGVVALVIGVVRAPAPWRAPFAGRVALASFAPLLLTFPWSLRLGAADGPLRAAVPADPVSSELWRWVLLVPDVAGTPGVLAGVGFLAAGILGVLFGWRRQPVLVTTLWATALGAAVLGWWAGASGAPTWPGLPLVVSAAAYAGLLAVAFARGERVLGQFAFGWRQVAAAVTVVGILVSLGAVAVDLVRGPGGTYVRDAPSLPQFITAVATDDDPFLVLVLTDVDDEVRFEVVPGGGPTMAATGVPDDPETTATVERAVRDLLAGRDVRIGSTLGALGMRFLVVPDGGVSEPLDAALRRQSGLEPRPVAAGRVLAVTDALPTASLWDPGDASQILEVGTVPADVEPEPLAVAPDGSVRGRTEQDATLLLARPDASAWRVTADGRELTPLDGPVPAYEVPAESTVRVEHRGATTRTVALVAQALLVLLVVSLALRPPGFARRRAAENAVASLDPRDVGEAPVRDGGERTGPARPDPEVRS